ncbi:ABC transporter ATP-binding protein, partial [Streptomyces sp. PH10-H1]|nr:ABC transporter ATP-binding protein [Streptomyces sp. PH10-H1]
KVLGADVVWLDLLGGAAPPLHLPEVAALRATARISGRRWTLRLPQARARAVVAEITGGRAFDALDDFTLATPSLEDVYLALGGRQKGLVKA